MEIKIIREGLDNSRVALGRWTDRFVFEYCMVIHMCDSTLIYLMDVDTEVDMRVISIVSDTDSNTA